MIIADEKAVYHVMSRTALDGFPLQDVEKDFMLDLIKRFSALYFTEILGFCLMGNHFHLLVKMIPEYNYTDDDIQKRFEAFSRHPGRANPLDCTRIHLQYIMLRLPC